VSVIDRLLEAMNGHDLEAFVACYAATATIEDGHDRVLARGHDELRARYGPAFELPDLHVEALHRIEVGDFVVQEERVTGRGAPQRHVAVYHVEANRIRRERLVS
jgi:putative hydrolase of HD superfamily